MKRRLSFFGLALALLLAAPAAAQDLAELGPAELVAAFQNEIAALKKTEAMLDANGMDAAANRSELEALNRESERLAAEAAAHNAAVEAHNRAIAAYNAECLGQKLAEDAYARCYALKNDLAAKKERLDAGGDALGKAHAGYNRKVAAFNEMESGRAAAAADLLKAFRAADEKIRFIQIRLYELSTQRGDGAFAERNRQCTLRPSLEEVYGCFAALWR